MKIALCFLTAFFLFASGSTGFSRELHGTTQKRGHRLGERVLRVSPETGLTMRVQIELGRRGYYRSRVDGVVGSRTLRSLRDFQKDNYLPISGRIDRGTLDQLRIK